MKTYSKAKPRLIIEKSDGTWWGRVDIKGTLIYEHANNLSALKKKIKTLILEFENIQVDDFELSYDLMAFFETYSYLNISDIAKVAGINPGLMRQYSSGNKFPSKERVKEIEKAVKKIGRELTQVNLHKSQQLTR